MKSRDGLQRLRENGKKRTPSGFQSLGIRAGSDVRGGLRSPKSIISIAFHPLNPAIPGFRTIVLLALTVPAVKSSEMGPPQAFLEVLKCFLTHFLA